MSQLDLKYSDIIEIFRNNLKAENLLMSVQSLFLSDRLARQIDYSPYFQRHYVWDEEKASYFIESIIIGTEIPPLVLFKSKGKYEVIDGRQRYETLYRFLNDKFSLKEKGLRCLSSLAGKHYSDLPSEIKDDFENTKLRVLKFSVVNEPQLDDEKEDRIKKEIFRRYNSGIIPLVKEDVQRAAYIGDDITNAFMNELNANEELYRVVENLLLPRSKSKKSKRDKITTLLYHIRRLLTMRMVPVYSYAHVSSKDEVIRVFYDKYISHNDPEKELASFKQIADMVRTVQDELKNRGSRLAMNNLLFECCFWAFSILLHENIPFHDIDIHRFCCIVLDGSDNYLWNGVKIEEHSTEFVFEKTGSHYYLNIVNRYLFVSNYFKSILNIDFSRYLKNSDSFNQIMNLGSKEQYDRAKLHKPDPASMSIEDIVSDMKKSRFLVRPSYQRSEVSNEQKASYLLESIMLGMCIPPIYVYRRTDKAKEVVDGQQRLLAILGFLGKAYLNDRGEFEFSQKNNFKLKKLRILHELNGKNMSDMESDFSVYIDKLLDFQINVVEIDAEINSDFSCIDLFLRLNSKPYPIQENSFEMWNAYAERELILEIRRIADSYSNTALRAKDTRMKNEELLATMAYMHFMHTRNRIEYLDLLNIYIKNKRLCARIASKKNVTKLLSDISQNEGNDVEKFKKSVEHTEVFLKKVLAIIDGDGDKLGMLMGQRRKGIQSKTDQNYYYLWLIFEEFDVDYIAEYRNVLFDRIRQFFLDTQDLESNDAAEFLRKKIAAISEKPN